MSIRNPENLDPALWESAGLRPITEEELESAFREDDWLVYDDQWISETCPSRKWTVCIPIHTDEEVKTLQNELRSALEGLLDHYVALVASGDAGFWNPEEEPQVIAARAALANTKGGA